MGLTSENIACFEEFEEFLNSLQTSYSSQLLLTL